MKLYHFTSRYHVDGCLYEGIKNGKVLHGDFDKRIYLIPGYQWLTRNPDFSQSWHDEELTSLPYDRTEYRIEVNIPRLREKNLIKWTKYCKDNPQPVHETLNAFGDLENWYLYHGTILPVWLGNVDRKING